MVKTKDKCKWQGVSLPVPFINMIYEHIKDDDTFRSVVDFVREAVRDKIRDKIRDELFTINDEGKIRKIIREEIKNYFINLVKR